MITGREDKQMRWALPLTQFLCWSKLRAALETAHWFPWLEETKLRKQEKQPCRNNKKIYQESFWKGVLESCRRSSWGLLFIIYWVQNEFLKLLEDRVNYQVISKRATTEAHIGLGIVIAPQGRRNCFIHSGQSYQNNISNDVQTSP